MMLLSHFGTFFLLENKLSYQQISIVFLTEILDFKLLVLLSKCSIFVVNILCNLSHSFEMFCEFFFLLLVIVLIFLFLECLFSEVVFHLLKSLFESFPYLVTFSFEVLAQLFLGDINLVIQTCHVSVQVFDVFIGIAIQILEILFLQLLFVKNLLVLIIIMNIDALQQVLILSLVFDEVQGLGAVLVDLLINVLNHIFVFLFPLDVTHLIIVHGFKQIIGPLLLLFVLLEDSLVLGLPVFVPHLVHLINLTIFVER